MQQTPINMRSLFAQLGEPSDEASVNRFVELNSPLADGMRLHEAPFWTPSQAAFLREAISQDADWTKVVDDLNARLHR
jgi:hypothetical protein